MTVTKKQLGYMLETLTNIRKKITKLDKLTLQLNSALYSVYRNMQEDAEMATAVEAVDAVRALATPGIVPESVAAAWYSVSLGNGNDGVSRSSPNYYVKTNDPYVLVNAGLLGALDSILWPSMKDKIDTCGDDALWGLSSTLSEGPNGETEFGVAWMICEVWPTEYDGEPNDGHPKYDNLESCFAPGLLKLLRET